MLSILEHFINVQMTRKLKRYQLCWIRVYWAGIKGQSNMHREVHNHFQAGETATLMFSSFTWWDRRWSSEYLHHTVFVGSSNGTAQLSQYWRICSIEQLDPKTVPYCSKYGLKGPTVSASPGNLLERRNVRLYPDLLDQNLHFNQIPR